MTDAREEEFANYRQLVEQRYTQMLEEEKNRLKRQFADKKDLLEKKLQFQNEEKLKATIDALKNDFSLT